MKLRWDGKGDGMEMGCGRDGMGWMGQLLEQGGAWGGSPDPRSVPSAAHDSWILAAGYPGAAPGPTAVGVKEPLAAGRMEGPRDVPKV